MRFTEVSMDTTKKFVKKATSPSVQIYRPQNNEPDLDHTQLPESDGTFVKNFQEHPQSLVLTSSIEPVLQKLHPDGRYCIGQDSGIYWDLTAEPPEKGAEAPDWFYVGNVPPLLHGEYRRSYVMSKEKVIPLIAIEFVSGNGLEERDATPPPQDPDEIDLKTGKRKKAGKFWVYEQAIRIPFYAIYEVKKASVEVYQLVNGRYQLISPNDRGHYAIPPMGIELGIMQDKAIAWLRFWDESGNLLLTGDERAEAEMHGRLRAELERSLEKDARLQAEAAQQRAEAIADRERLAKQRAEAIAMQEHHEKEKLAAYLRSMGINPDEIP
jgi:Uma2 family endonuclease